MPPQIDFDPSIDFYRTLGVDAKSTPDDVKKAYRKLAKANHPDSTGGDKSKESRFKEIQNAYDVLGDPKKRQLYDQIRAGGGMRNSPGPGTPGASYTYSNAGPGVFDLNDLFGQFFHNAQAGGRAPRAEPERDAQRRRPAKPEPEEIRQVKASDGTWLEVRGTDVHSDVRVTFDRAILGTVATVVTIDGKAEVRVPGGTSSGKKLRLRGKGMTDRAGATGDHYVTVQIDVPTGLDDDAKTQLVQLVKLIARLRERDPTD